MPDGLADWSRSTVSTALAFRGPGTTTETIRAFNSAGTVKVRACVGTFSICSKQPS